MEDEVGVWETSLSTRQVVLISSAPVIWQ